MKSIQNNLRVIKRRIMLRVWYSYIISLVVNPVALAGMVLGASIGLFFKLFSVSSLIHNLLAVQLGAVPQYIWLTLVSIVNRGEFLKLISLVLIVVSLIYLRKLLKDTHFGQERFVRSV